MSRVAALCLIVLCSISSAQDLGIPDYERPPNMNAEAAGHSTTSIMRQDSNDIEHANHLLLTYLASFDGKSQALLSLSLDEAQHFVDRDEKKSASKAFLIAFFPGFLIHGLGHHYADQHVVGFALLGAEVVSIYLINESLKDGWFTGGGDEGPDIRIGLGIFFASWLADVIRAPLVVSSGNKSQSRSSSSNLDFDTGIAHSDIKVEYIFRF